MHSHSSARRAWRPVPERGVTRESFGLLLADYLRADRAGIIIFALILFLSASLAHSQNVRWDLGAPGSAGVVTTSQGSVLVALGNVQLAWCVYPANAVPCTNFANTYPSITSSSACPTNAQVVLQGSNSCVATSDSFGNLGVYAPAGTYAYTLTANGTSYGPFLVTLGAGGGIAPLTGLPGDIIRFNVAGDGAWDAVGYPQLYTEVFACSVNVSCALGINPGNSTGCCGESASGLNPTASAPFLMTTYSAGAVGSTSTVIGLQQSENGNTGDWFVRGFWRMSHKLSITPSANTRYWWGLGVWNNGSSLGTNATNVLGTTAFAADSPNHTFIGWRWSSTTDANFKAVVIQAGASPTTVVIDTGVAVDSNLHTFDVGLDSGNTTYSFYIDGKLVGSTAASTITFSPANAGDALATMFFTGDNKNTATAVSATFASMAISLRQ